MQRQADAAAVSSLPHSPSQQDVKPVAAHDAHTCHTIHSRVRIHLLCSCRCSRHVGSGGGERRWQRSTAAGKDATRFTRSVSVLLHPCAKHAPVASDPARAAGDRRKEAERRTMQRSLGGASQSSLLDTTSRQAIARQRGKHGNNKTHRGSDRQRQRRHQRRALTHKHANERVGWNPGLGGV